MRLDRFPILGRWRQDEPVYRRHHYQLFRIGVLLQDILNGKLS